MKYKQKSIYSVEGISATKLESELLIYESDNVRSYFIGKDQLNDECYEIDTAAVYALFMLTGKLSKENEAKLDEELAQEIEKIQRKRSLAKDIGAYCVIEIKGNTTVEINEKFHNKISSTHLCFDAVDKEIVFEKNRNEIESILLAVSLITSSNSGIKKVIEGISFYPKPDEILFSYTIRAGSVNAIVSRNIEEDQQCEIAQFAVLIHKESKLQTVFKLYVQSLDKQQGKFRAFIDAWLALEIFVNKVFKEYEGRYIDELQEYHEEKGLSDFIGRVHVVMKSKYRLTDKFSLIATYLSASPQDHIKRFKEIKLLRDGVFHGEDIDEESLPLEHTKNIVLELIKNHLKR